jgi:hypothetical protein
MIILSFLKPYDLPLTSIATDGGGGAGIVHGEGWSFRFFRNKIFLGSWVLPFLLIGGKKEDSCSGLLQKR